MHYNPLAYIHSEKDILKLVNCLIANTKRRGQRRRSISGRKSETLLYTALIGYLWQEAVPEEDRNFATLIDMIDSDAGAGGRRGFPESRLI